jgi:uncharacterized protein with HEPN domain
MDNLKKKLLRDIADCVEHIENYLGDERLFEEYDKNMLLQDAIERNIITIGEAVNLLLRSAPEINITNARRMVDVGNKLTHGYDEIENVQVWNIIINHLPALKIEVERFLKE